MANKPPALANAPKDYDASYFNKVFRVLTQHLNGQADSTNSAPAFSTSGNLTFTGLGNRIIGDFSNATITNRVQVQTSTVNGNTYFGLLPNGTATQSYFSAHNAADPTNSGAIRLKIDSTAAYLESGRNGTGAYLPLQLFTNGTLAATIATDHSLTTTASLTIGSGGAYVAGSLYSDANWGMILRAKQTSPAASQFLFVNSSGTELARINNSSQIVAANITAAGSVTGSSVSLAIARTINGIAFDGTANINQPGAPFYDVGQSPAQTYTQAQTASDLNLCVMAGDYNFNNTSTNRPAGLDQWGFLHVGRHSNDTSGNTYVHQTAYDMNGTNVAAVYVRRGIPSTGFTCTWSPWVRVDTGVGMLAFTDVKASRSFGTTYTNTKDRPIEIRVSAQTSSTGIQLYLTVNGFQHTYASAGAVTNCAISGIIPPGLTYVVTEIGTTVSVNSWLET